LRALGIGIGLILAAVSAVAQPQVRASGPLHIVAAMVEFQPESNRFTTGDGTFDLPFLRNTAVTIDPLPHDRGYFQARLEFVKGYFERESGGAVSITYEVLPAVHRLDHPMRRYSPTGQSDSANYRLAWLARDSWEKVRQSGALNGRGFDPDRTLFILFHAGSGRNLELTGTTLTITPQDIPSVYLSRESIADLLQDSAFEGFPINADGDAVMQTAILPQTNSRPGRDVTGADFVLELSVNGLAAAMVGNFMGLPDLYNTTTGQSGIGRFGLMDGAGFFAYNGLFPPSLSAWERIRLGWADPTDIDLNDTAPIELPLGRIVRYRITADETVLIENRHRDPTGNGVTLTIRKPDGTRQTVSIPRSERRFDPFDFRSIDEILPAGTLVDVSRYDWALPGGPDIGPDGLPDTTDDRFLSGGILIWRINEAVVRSGLRSNRINADSDRRGVELVEADGARDIGRPTRGLTSYDQGAPFDFWWSGNDFTVITATGQRIVRYQNRWGHDTQPDNRSLGGARTGFEFYGFSANIPDASFRARMVTDPAVQVRPAIVLPQGQPYVLWSEFYRDAYPLALDLAGARVIVPGPGGFSLIDTVARTTEPVVIPSGLNHQPAVASDAIYAATIGDGEVNRYDRPDDTQAATLDWSRPGSGTAGYAAFRQDTLFLPHRPTVFTSAGAPVNLPFTGQVSSTGDRVLAADGLYDRAGARIASIPFQPFRRLHLTDVRRNGMTDAHWIVQDNRIFHVKDAEAVLAADRTSIDFPAFADFGDGAEAAVFVDRSRNTLEAVHATGASFDGFPVHAPSGLHFLGTPVPVDIDGDTRTDLVVMATDGYSLVLFGYDRTGTLIGPFPLLVGAAPPDGSLPLQPLFENRTLHTVSATGEYRAFTFPSAAPTAPWNLTRASVSIAEAGALQNRLLVEAETYNWPNPALDHTHIRLQTRADAEVDIRIIAYDGRPVWSDRFRSTTAVVQERRIDTSGWSSGAYFVRVEARDGGRLEQKRFTMAVIR
jgi:hypothetical protein